MKNKVAIIILSLLVIICGVIIFTGVDGKSAYELACENGYEGTLEEWLVSLKADNSSNQYNVTSGDNYNITVNTDQTVEEAAASKALLSTVSVTRDLVCIQQVHYLTYRYRYFRQTV